MGLAVLAPFQNCGMVSEHTEKNEFASKACGQVVGDAYKASGYYETFRQSCTNCHDSGGVAGRPFASNNFSEAVESFMSVGRKKIEANAINPGHKPPNTGAQHQPMITAANTIWKKAEAAAADCFNNDAIRTTEKPLPSTVYTTTPANGAAWPRLTFNLQTELAEPGSVPFPVNVQVSIEVRRMRVANVDMGYEVKNPRASVLGDPTQKFRIEGIKIVKNRELMSDFTFFSELDFTFTGNTETLLQAGGNYSAVTPLGPISTGDRVALEFANIETGPQLVVTGTGGGQGSVPGGGGGTVVIPSRVTHMDLLSSNQVTGVFNRYCVGCHNTNNQSGGLSLQDYTETFALRDNIRARMTNAANPMPPGGLINDNGIAIQVIDVWLGSGAPQN